MPHDEPLTTTPPSSAGPPQSPKSLEALCLQLQARVMSFLDTPQTDEKLKGVQDQVRAATAVIDEALRRYTPEELSISYNGGKDCLVLLILLLASLPSRFGPSSSSSSTHPNDTTETTATTTTKNADNSSSPFPQSLQAIYIRPPLPFPEVDSFVTTSTAHYHLSLTTSNKPMKAALSDYLTSHPSVRAVFVGTRRTDPHGADLGPFDPTDADWPPFMRVHPVVDWHYREIWGFIRALGVEYCPLYDRGYTSLGGTDDTHPNPALMKKGPNGDAAGTEIEIPPSVADAPVFRPAYELMEDDEERLGRDR